MCSPSTQSMLYELCTIINPWGPGRRQTVSGCLWRTSDCTGISCDVTTGPTESRRLPLLPWWPLCWWGRPSCCHMMFYANLFLRLITSVVVWWHSLEFWHRLDKLTNIAFLYCELHGCHTLCGSISTLLGTTTKYHMEENILIHTRTHSYCWIVHCTWPYVYPTMI